MSIELYLIALLLALASLYFVFPLVAGAFVRYRGKRVITCPETRKPAAIEVDAGHAALTAAISHPELRLKACSRWPEREALRARVPAASPAFARRLSAQEYFDWLVRRQILRLVRKAIRRDSLAGQQARAAQSQRQDRRVERDPAGGSARRAGYTLSRLLGLPHNCDLLSPAP